MTITNDDPTTGQVRAHLDAEAGRIGRDEALDAIEAARPTVAEVVLAAIDAILTRSDDPDLRFTTDDIWVELGDTAETIAEPRDMGVAMRAARRAGIITPTDNYLPSGRPACHARPVRVWRRASTGSTF